MSLWRGLCNCFLLCGSMGFVKVVAFDMAAQQPHVNTSSSVIWHVLHATALKWTLAFDITANSSFHCICLCGRTKFPSVERCKSEKTGTRPKKANLLFFSSKIFFFSTKLSQARPSLLWRIRGCTAFCKDFSLSFLFSFIPSILSPSLGLIIRSILYAWCSWSHSFSLSWFPSQSHLLCPIPCIYSICFYRYNIWHVLWVMSYIEPALPKD